MLVGVISDTHGLLRSEACRALAECTLIVHAGDIGPQQILDQLSGIGPVHAVRGNMDRDAWARRLPVADKVELDGCALWVLHNLEELDISPEALGAAVVVSGHTHRPHEYHQRGVLYFNPGSAGPRRNKLVPSVGRLRVVNGQVRAEVVPLGPA